MAAYCLFDNLEVLDADALAEYARRTAPVVEAHGGRYLTTGGAVHAVEGEHPLTMPVLITFPDLEAAFGWYDAPEYQELKALRHSAVRCDATFFEG